MKVSDYIAKFIEEQNCRYIFGYIGGAITHLVDSISKNDKLTFIQVYHEQTASFAAEGFSRGCDSIGVAMATSGPGATNLITGIADAFFDSLPVVFITGQVNTYEYKYNKPIRQQGFQETDIISIVKPVTKYAVFVDKKENIRYELEKAYSIAKSGRPGPVLIDIPMDIQRSEIDADDLIQYKPEVKIDSAAKPDINIIQKYLNESKRPIILSGGGVLSGKANDSLYSFSKKFGIPVVVSLMGKGSFPEDDDLFAGMIGSYGNRCANIVLSNSDLVFAVGTRLDTRQTGTRIDEFMRKGKIIHVDIDEFEILHNRVERDYAVSMDSKLFFDSLIDNINENYNTSSDWIEYVHDIKSRYNQKKEIELNVNVKTPYKVMEMLSRYADDNAAFCVDIGQNQMFAAQSLVIKKDQNFYTSGGMAPMGYAIPAAIGISFACNNTRSIIAIAGDGGFHISTQSLMLLSQYNLPVKVVVLNNKSLGMIVQFQDLYFNHNEAATTKRSGYFVPDIKLLSASYDIEYIAITDSTVNDEELWKDILLSKKPMVIEVIIDSKTVVSPKLEVNTTLEDLSPKISAEEMGKIMIKDKF
ncbi:MAG: acetolactate synthase [Spirochaetae bacterium HGW-Spirochaetae-5]|nr:MAG: acetolactate synthase [Spirochaetae bacterium HGW-Spirochaetae-5]